MKKMKLTKLTLPPSPVRLVDQRSTLDYELAPGCAVAGGENMELGASGENSLPAFTLVAYTGGKAQPKDMPCPVVIDLTGLDIPVQKMPVRFEHKSFQGVGHTEKIVIVGNGKVGCALSELLTAEGHSITIIDNNSRILDSANVAMEVMCVDRKSVV